MDTNVFDQDLIQEIAMATVKSVKSKPKSVAAISKEETVEKYPKIKSYIDLTLKKIEYIKEVLQALYPDNWDIEMHSQAFLGDSYKSQMESGIGNIDHESGEFVLNSGRSPYFSSKYFTVYIRFPEITVNDKKRNHVMREIYIRMVYNFDLTVAKPDLARGQKTWVEYSYNYNFSHAKVGNIPGFYPLCYGSTDYDTLVSEMHFKWNDIRFEQFVIQLPDYLSHESYDGGPYIRIESLVSKSTRATFSKPADVDLDGIYRSIVEKGLDNLIFTHRKLGNTIKFNPATGTELWEEISTFTPEAWRFPYDEVSGKTFFEELAAGTSEAELKRYNDSLTKSPFLTFRGNKIILKIVNSVIKSTDKKRYVHESVRDYILGKLNQNINKFFINEFRKDNKNA